MAYKVGDVFLCKNSGLFASLIKFGNLLRYGHTGYAHASIIGNFGIIPGTKTPGIYVYEAIDDGFIGSWYEEWWVDARLADKSYKQLRANQKLNAVEKFCKDYEGQGYDWRNIFYIPLYWFLHVKNLPESTKKLICSEAVARVLYDSSGGKIDFEKEFGIDYDLISPEDIDHSKQLVEVLND